RCSPTTMPVSSATYGAFTLMVGQTKIPRSAIMAASCSSNRRSLVSVTNEQCSIVVTPASAARRMPSVPWAWAATGMSTRLASATISASCAVGHQDGRLFVGLGPHPGDRVRPAVEAEVDVAVDQPRQDRRVRVVRPRQRRVLGGQRREGTGPVDRSVADDDRAVRYGLVAG